MRMEERIGNKPKVIAYLRSQYSSDALPDWVGKFVNEDDATEEELDTEDVQEGTPVQANATVANDFESQAPTDSRGQSRTLIHGHP
jgi:hypothetical protein